MGSRRRSPIWLVAVLASGCTGVLGETTSVESGAGSGDGDGDGDGGTGAGSPGETCSTLATTGAPVPMRRLTALQVMRSVADVLGVSGEVQVSDERLFAFRSNISSSVDFASARGYLDFAEATAAEADLGACAEVTEACEAWLFDDVGARLFRRPMLDDERARYEATFEEGVLEGGAPEGARWVLEAMLQSPSFLYLDEVTREDGYLDDHSMASRLALTLWGANPDAALLAMAERGELATPEQVAATATTMLADPRSVGGLTDFVDQWLRLDRLDDPDARPDLEELEEETRRALREEPVLLTRLLIEEGGDITALLSAPRTVASPALDGIYGDDVVSTSEGRTELDPDRRAGILAMPGVMAALAHAGATSPTLRGFNILSNFVCTPPAPPPAGVSVTLPDLGPGKSTRERLEAHFSDPTCNACHGQMDGIGFAFEGIDWLGRSRDTEFGEPIDDVSTFPLAGEEVTVDGPRGLAEAMAESPDVAACVVRQWASYGAGIPDKQEAACLIEHMAEEAQQPEGLRSMILALVASDWYRRGPEESP